MDDSCLNLFGSGGKITPQIAWNFYQSGLNFNNQINLDATVKSNENFYIGKQWEGVQSNGLPTPQFNIIKRVVNFSVATITTDSVKVNATALANTPDTGSLAEPVRIVNEEFEALNEANNVSSLLREFARNAAVDGDGCLYTYWDTDADAGYGKKGAVRTEIIGNTRVIFGNPNDRLVQSQPYIQIVKRDIARNTRKRAKENGSQDWDGIVPDSDSSNATDGAKYTDDKVTVLLTLWRDDEDGEIHAFESTQNCVVKNPYSLGIRLYPICWLCWDYIQDCYHGQAMVTGLIPNQIFINKAYAMSMLSMMRTSFPKIIYDRTRISGWDNRVGGAIPVNGGDINSVARIIDPASISPQISQFIQMAIEETEQSLGATSVALGDTRPDNTSAILALQRAASTPAEITKQNLYRATEDLFRIYLEFMAANYGRRMVDMEPPKELREAAEWSGSTLPDEIALEFDFDTLKNFPMELKLDVGASSYYSEIASMQTLDALLQAGHINIVQYLERIPDYTVPGKRALINEKRQELKMQMQAVQPQENQTPKTFMGGTNHEIKGGSGYGSLQRQINRTGSTEGLI